MGFFKLHLQNDLTQSQTLDRIEQLYTMHVSDRWIYYGVIAAAYQLLCLTLWLSVWEQRAILYYGLTALLTPSVTNYLARYQFSRVLAEWKQFKTQSVRFAGALVLSQILNFLSLVCVDLRPNIHWSELLPLFHKKTSDYFRKVIMNFLIATAVQYTHNNGRTLYSRLIRYVYHYNTGKKISRVDNDKSAKEKFVKVIVHRDWKELLRPDILQTLFHLYETSEEGVLYRFFTECEYRILQGGALWTIVTTVLHLPPWWIPLLSLGLITYRYNPLRENNAPLDHRDSNQMREESAGSKFSKRILGRVCALSWGLCFPDHYLIVTILSEFSYYLIFRWAVDWIQRWFQKQINKYVPQTVGGVGGNSLQYNRGILIGKTFVKLVFQHVCQSYHIRFILGGLTSSILSHCQRERVRPCDVTPLPILAQYILTALILAPDLVTALGIFAQFIFLTLSHFNPSHAMFLGLIIQATQYIHEVLHSEKASKDESSLLVGCQSQWLTETNLLESWRPTNDTVPRTEDVAKTERAAETERAVRTEKVAETENKDEDDGDDDSPLISEEASRSLIKSLPSGIHADLSKSYYLDKSESEDEDILDEYVAPRAP